MRLRKRRKKCVDLYPCHKHGNHSFRGTIPIGPRGVFDEDRIEGKKAVYIIGRFSDARGKRKAFIF